MEDNGYKPIFISMFFTRAFVFSLSIYIYIYIYIWFKIQWKSIDGNWCWFDASVPGNSMSRYRGVGVASQTHSYTPTQNAVRAVCLAAVKLEPCSWHARVTGFRDFLFRALISTAIGNGEARDPDVERDRERERGVGWGGAWGGRGSGEQSPLWKITYGQLALRFCGIAIHARAQTLARGRKCACSVQFYMQFRGGRRSPQDGGVFNYI